MSTNAPSHPVPHLILVTRPQTPGRALAAQLRAAGVDALWWPAFDLLPPQDPSGLRATIAHLDEYDFTVFVSPAAVRAFADAFGAESGNKLWPETTAIGVVGTATRAAVLAQLPGARRARLLCPEGDAAAEGGSEALWAVLPALGSTPRKVLIARAQSGRQWLSDQFAAAGAQVEEVEAYQRVAHAPTTLEWSALHAGLASGRRLAALLTSTEAVAALIDSLGRDRTARAALDACIALSIHPRITAALLASGMHDVHSCSADVTSIIAALGAARAHHADFVTLQTP